MNKHILIVDDEPGLLASMKLFLSGAGHRVSTATSAQAALEAMKTAVPDAIVCDLHLPEVDGVAFYHRVREHTEWQAIPFVFLTGGNRISALEDKPGVRAVLTKPFNVADLMVILGNLGKDRED